MAKAKAKSKGSCFRVMACACGDSASSDELLLLKSKASSDKSRWSFRKRVSGPRVLSRNAILEPEFVDYNKESTEAIPSSFNSAMNVCVSEKASIQKNPSKEEFPVGPALSSTAVNSKVSATVVTGYGPSNDENVQESAAIIIQTAIRGHLGVRKLGEVQYVIKLQAAIRGHLVRAHAVGTLHCIRAIIKMQAIVRAHLSQLKWKVAGIMDNKLERNRNGLYVLGKGNCCEGTRNFYSTKRLLSNRFVQQMLASTPKTRPIYIKCDPSKSDAAWKWLERWTAIISSHTEEENDESLNYGDKEDVNSSKLAGNEEKPDNSKSGLSELSTASESKGDPNATSKDNLRIRSADCLSDSCVSSVEKDEESDIEIKEVSKRSISFSSHIRAQSAFSPQQTDGYSSHKNESKANNLNNPSKKEHYGSSEIEAQKFAIWSKRPCNPAFTAAQSKFEELASNSNVRCIGSFSSAHQDCTADARIENYHSQVKKYKESRNPIIQVAASECGTEISISSTLDSPDRSETDCGEIILEIGSIDKHNYDANNCSDNLFILASKGAERQACESNKLEEAVTYTCFSSNALDMAPPAQQQEPIASESQDHLETANFQRDATSVEGTPRSHTTALEAYGTPSSEISLNAGSKNKDGDTPSQKQRLTGSGRKLAPMAVSDSFTRRSSEKHLSIDSKNGKKRLSAGASGTDLDDEPRMSNSNSSSLPSYMQATKSARAKVHANNSPKSSPDLHDKDSHMKKRHSLPTGNGKRDSSPPKQGSTQRAQHNPKSNDMHAPHTSADCIIMNAGLEPTSLLNRGKFAC